MGINAPGSYYRDMFLVLFFVSLYHFHNGADFFIISFLIVGLRHIFCICAVLCQFFPGKSQMSACQWSFYYYKIRNLLIFSVPKSANDLCGLCRRYDRSQFYFLYCLFADLSAGFFCLCKPRFHFLICSLRILWKTDRKACAGYNGICAGFNGFLDPQVIMFGGYHDIKTDNALWCDFSGFLHLPSDCTQIGFYKVGLKIRFPETDLCCGDQSHTTGSSYGSRQFMKADSYAHTALDHWPF